MINASNAAEPDAQRESAGKKNERSCLIVDGTDGFINSQGIQTCVVDTAHFADRLPFAIFRMKDPLPWP